MRFFRLLLAGLISLAVMVMGFFVAAFVVLAGLFAKRCVVRSAGRLVRRRVRRPERRGRFPPRHAAT